MKKLLIIFLIICLCSCSQKSESLNNALENVENVSGSAEYLNNYNIPLSFGRAKYTVEEIVAMKDYSVEQLQQAISTISDLMQYYIETGFLDDYIIDWDYELLCNDYILSVNRTPQATLDNKSHCCGDISSLSRYILEGDYDEEGYIIEAHCSDNEVCGGHVYNYFKNGEDYFSIDFTVSNKYELAKANRAKNLDEFGQYVRHNAYYVYGMVATVDYKDICPALVSGFNTEHGRTCTFFFDNYYKDNIIKLHYDLDEMKEIKHFEIHELFEDIGYDKTKLPQDNIDADIGNLENNN